MAGEPLRPARAVDVGHRGVHESVEWGRFLSLTEDVRPSLISKLKLILQQHVMKGSHDTPPQSALV